MLLLQHAVDLVAIDAREARGWAIFAGHEKKPLMVGSFYGTIEKVKEHAVGGNIASERTYSETQIASLKVVERELLA